jgi:uncharacterized protein YecE (DUF72 family)
VETYIGTSGWSYPPWRGSFYPEKTKTAEMLPYYASKLRTVEVNNTFYRMPNPELLAGWAAATPAGFRFAPKAPQIITHRQKLLGSEQPVARFFEVARSFGGKLGPALFQLPPTMKKDVPRLAAFLALLQTGTRAAFEFRHDSWFADDVYEALRAGGASLCIAEAEDLATPLVSTAPWGYLRLRRQDYDDAALASWAGRLRDPARGWDEAFVFFKHEDEGRGPALASRLEALLAPGP